MKKFVALGLMSLFTLPALASWGPMPLKDWDTTPMLSVEQAKSMNDNTQVDVKGHIVKRIGGNYYRFRDGTGSMVVEANHDLVKSLKLKKGETIELQGVIDKDSRSTELQVENIIKM